LLLPQVLLYHPARDARAGTPAWAELSNASGVNNDKMILDSFKLNGKVALVTGASAGLGAAIAVALAEAGADVAAHGNSRAPETTCELIERTRRPALPVLGNLGDKAVPEQLISQTLAHFGQLDILINNAGTIRRAPAVDYSEEDWPR
jgi:2-deoxy-D-gluconate 3-dehydrogenase